MINIDDKPLHIKAFYYALSAFNAQIFIQIMHPLDVIKTRL
jgi:hypothetical protein